MESSEHPQVRAKGCTHRITIDRQDCSELKIPTNRVTCWVDSMNMGYWIQGQSRDR